VALVPKVIGLNDVEQRICKYVARCRNQYGRENGIENKKKGPQSDELTDLNGMGAELVFCKIHNIYPDLDIGILADDDCLLPSGLGVDVKTTTYLQGRLLVGLNKKEKQADIYALLVGSFPNYRYAGMMSAKEIFNDENIGNTGHGDCYLIDQKRLNHA
jgi:hypothetical protein